MDITAFLGVLLGCGLIIQAIGIEKGIHLFVHPTSFLIVMGGTFGATLVHFPLTQLFRIGGRLKVIFSPRGRDYLQDIKHMSEIATNYKKNGRLSLEKTVKKTQDHYLKHGLQLLIDNIPVKELVPILEKNIDFIQSRHNQGIHFFEQMAQYAPGFGFIGTLIGLINLLSELESPETIGPNMAIALITTFYGILLANLIFQPLSGRLRIASNEELIQKKMLLEGIICIAQKETNYMIYEKMSMCLPEKERKKLKPNK